MREDNQNDNPLWKKYLDDELIRNASGTSFATPRAISRQLQVFKLFTEGYTSQEIAFQLNMSELTVRTYRVKMRDAYEATLKIGWSRGVNIARPPFNAEYLLHLLLRKDERDVVIGDLIEDYRKLLERFNKRHADIWFYKQVAGSLFPLLRRALLRIGALVWLGRVLRRLIS